MSEPIEPLEITPTLLLRAYAAGVFPMAHGADSDEIFWVDPRKRGILPLPAFHVSRSLARRIRRGGFEVSVDRDFEGVLNGCAAREETWINPEIRQLYLDLHRLGRAHSIELRENGALAGGLYGVELGAAFFGESMFSAAPDASKIALVWLMARLKVGGFTLLDTQFVTDHLRGFGAVEVPREHYHTLLDAALKRQSDFWALPEDAAPSEVLQLSTHTS